MAFLLMGIEIGTAACKISIFTPDGEMTASVSSPYKVYHPQPGWAEQNPEEWWQGVCSAIRKLEAEGTDLSEIAAIGVAGQSWSAIPIDQNGEVLCNTPIWYDNRAEKICTYRKQHMGTNMEVKLFEHCGNPLQATYTLPKILWIQEERPEIYQKTHKFLQSNSYIVYRLTGEITQDKSQGYGIHCYDIEKEQWDESVCQFFGIDMEKLPPLLASHEIAGVVQAKASKLSGLPLGIPVVAGGLDTACGTLGAGVIHPGETQEHGGQAGGMSICLDRCCADPKLVLGSHVVPGRWLLQGGTVGGGSIMRWVEEQLGTQARLDALAHETTALEELDREAERIPAGSDGVVFLPYMAGERSPVWDSNAKGVFYGLDYTKTHGHMVRAAMEGVAFSLQHNLDISSRTGTEVKELRAVGGAANSELWTQIKADVTGKEILVPHSDEAVTLGAALLAGVGTGIYGDFDEAVNRTVRICRKHEPDLDCYRVYRKSYDIYLKLYQSLKGLMKEQAE